MHPMRILCHKHGHSPSGRIQRPWRKQAITRLLGRILTKWINTEDFSWLATSKGEQAHYECEKRYGEKCNFAAMLLTEGVALRPGTALKPAICKNALSAHCHKEDSGRRKHIQRCEREPKRRIFEASVSTKATAATILEGETQSNFPQFKNIPHTAHGMKELCWKRIINLATQPAHSYLDHIRIAAEVNVPHLLCQVHTRQDLTLLLH